MQRAISLLTDYKDTKGEFYEYVSLLGVVGHGVTMETVAYEA